MLTEICNYLKNWFSDERYFGRISISDGVIYCGESAVNIAEGQYFRIIGSIASDGVYKYGTDELSDETFAGAVWLMRVPKNLITLAGEISAWEEKYGGVDSAAMSPYNSESFGGYSYSKSSGGSAADGSDAPSSWQSVYKAQLTRYKKI